MISERIRNINRKKYFFSFDLSKLYVAYIMVSVILTAIKLIKIAKRTSNRVIGIRSGTDC